MPDTKYKIPVRAEYAGNNTVGLSEYQNRDADNNEVISRKFGGTGLDNYDGAVGDILIIGLKADGSVDEDSYKPFTLSEGQILIGAPAGQEIKSGKLYPNEETPAEDKQGFYFDHSVNGLVDGMPVFKTDNDLGVDADVTFRSLHLTAPITQDPVVRDGYGLIVDGNAIIKGNLNFTGEGTAVFDSTSVAISDFNLLLGVDGGLSDHPIPASNGTLSLSGENTDGSLKYLDVISKLADIDGKWVLVTDITDPNNDQSSIEETAFLVSAVNIDGANSTLTLDSFPASITSARISLAPIQYTTTDGAGIIIPAMDSDNGSVYKPIKFTYDLANNNFVSSTKLEVTDRVTLINEARTQALDINASNGQIFTYGGSRTNISLDATGAADRDQLVLTTDNNVNITSTVGITGATTITGDTGITGATTISGNVGIGTNDPSNKLHVKSASDVIVDIEAGTESTNHYSMLRMKPTGNQNSYLRFDGNFYSQNIGGTDFLTILSGGNVGIGTNSPDGLLDINKSSGANNVYIQSATGSYRRIIFKDNSESPTKHSYQVAVQEVDNSIHIGPSSVAGGENFSGAIGLLINSDGKVGIGTNAPGNYHLNVNGSLYSTAVTTGDVLSGNDITLNASTGNIDATTAIFSTNLTIGSRTINESQLTTVIANTTGDDAQELLSTSSPTFAGITLPNNSITNDELVNDSLTVTAGDGLKDGGSVALGGSVTLNVRYDNSTITSTGDAIHVKDGGIVTAKIADAAVTPTQLDRTYLEPGDEDSGVINISTGGGLTGGPIVGSGTISHDNTSDQASSINNPDRTYIQNIELDEYGHVITLSTGSETVTDTTYSVGDGGLTEKNFTGTLKSKLDGIATGAEVNVKSDWNALSGDAEILHKPNVQYTSAIPSASASNDGLATQTQIAKLDGIAAGATNVTDNNQIGNSSGYITQPVVTSAITDLIGDASGGGDTLGELEDRIETIEGSGYLTDVSGASVNYANTANVANNLSDASGQPVGYAHFATATDLNGVGTVMDTLAPKASPTFTGTVTVSAIQLADGSPIGGGGGMPDGGQPGQILVADANGDAVWTDAFDCGEL